MLRVKAVKELPALGGGTAALGAAAGREGVSRDVMGEPINLDSPGIAWAAAQLLEVAAGKALVGEDGVAVKVHALEHLGGQSHAYTMKEFADRYAEHFGSLAL